MGMDYNPFMDTRGNELTWIVFIDSFYLILFYLVLSYLALPYLTLPYLNLTYHTLLHCSGPVDFNGRITV
jgi:hypothetical protein